MFGITISGDLPEGELVLSRSDFADDESGLAAFDKILKLYNIHPRNWHHIEKVRFTFVRRAVEVWNDQGTKILI